MSRYGSGKNYNSSTNYGATAATEGGDILWMLVFDWNNDGTYDSVNESNRLLSVSTDRGRQTYFAPQGGGFDHTRPGRLNLTLDNHDRRYDPRYASSPLYPNVKPGRRMFLAAIDLSANITYPIFTGLIDDIVPFNKPGGGEVQIECVDYMAALNDQALNAAAAGQNLTITSALETLLVDARYPAGNALDAEAQPVIVYGVTDQNAGQVAHDLADAGMGTFFINWYGIATYYARNHTYPVAIPLDQAQCLDEPLITQPWNEVYNHVTAIASRPIRKQPSVIYFLPGPVALVANTPYVLDVDYQSAFDVQVNTIAAWSEKTATGTNLTSATTVSPSLGYNGGTVTVTCTSNAYLTTLEIRGRMWGVVEEKKVSEDTTSQTTYGIRRFILNSQFLQDPNYAANHAEVIKEFAKNDRESLTVQIEGREDLQFGFDLMKPVAFTATTLDISATYYVMGVKHDWKIDTGQGVITTLYLSRIIADATVVTPAEVLNEPVVAPPGYEDPGGDPDTSSSEFDNDLGFEAIGDLLVGSDALGGWDNLPVGTDGYVLTADSGEVLGVKWAEAGGSAGSGTVYSLFTAGDDGTNDIVWSTSKPGIFCASGVPTDCDTILIAPGSGTINVYAVFYTSDQTGGGNVSLEWEYDVTSMNGTLGDIGGNANDADVLAIASSEQSVRWHPLSTGVTIVGGETIRCNMLVRRNEGTDTYGHDVWLWAFAIKYT